MEMLLWMLGLAWKILCFGVGIVLIRCALSKDVRETLKLAIQTGCIKLKRWLIKELSKDKVDGEDENANGTVN